MTFTGFTHAESWEFQIGGAPVSVPIRSRLQVDAAEAVVEAALAGAGIARLFSYHVAQAVKDGRLLLLLEEFEPPQLPVNLVYLGGGLLPLKVRAFLDFAAPEFGINPLLAVGEPVLGGGGGGAGSAPGDGEIHRALEPPLELLVEAVWVLAGARRERRRECRSRR